MSAILFLLASITLLASPCRADAATLVAPCRPEQQKVLFPPSDYPAIRIVLTHFSAGSAAAKRVADAVTDNLEPGLSGRLRMALSPVVVQVVPVPCSVTSHAQARLLAQAWDSDWVIWGEASPQGRQHDSAPEASVNLRLSLPAGTSIGSNNQIQAAPSATVQAGIILNQPTFRVDSQRKLRGLSRMSLTVLKARGMKQPRFRFGPPAIQEVDLPPIPWIFSSDLLTQLAITVQAFTHQGPAKAAEAFRLLRALVQSLGAGAFEGLGEYEAANALLMNRVPIAVAAHQDALAKCPLVSAHCVLRRLAHLAWAHEQTGYFNKALDTVQDALALSAVLGNEHALASMLDNKGRIQQRQQLFTESIKSHSEALAIFERLGDLHGQGLALNNLEKYKQSFDLLMSSRDFDSAGMALINMGLTGSDSRHETMSAAHLLKARQLFVALDNSLGLMIVDSNIVEPLMAKKLEGILDSAKNSAHFYASIAAMHARMLLDGHDASIYKDLAIDESDKQSFYLGAAITHCLRARSNSDDDRTQLNYWSQIEDTDQTLERLLDYLSSRDREGPLEILEKVADIYRKRKDPQGEAKILVHMARTLSDYPDFHYGAMDIKNIQKGISAYQEAARIFKKLGRVDLVAQILNEIGWCYYAIEDKSQAAASFRLGLAEVNSPSYYDIKIKLYMSLALLYAQIDENGLSRVHWALKNALEICIAHDACKKYSHLEMAWSLLIELESAKLVDVDGPTVGSRRPALRTLGGNGDDYFRVHAALINDHLLRKEEFAFDDKNGLSLRDRVRRPCPRLVPQVQWTVMKAHRCEGYGCGQ